MSALRYHHDDNPGQTSRWSLYCPEGWYWLIRCNHCGEIETGKRGESCGLLWHSQCVGEIAEMAGEKTEKVTRWWAREGYLWINSQDETYQP